MKSLKIPLKRMVNMPSGFFKRFMAFLFDLFLANVIISIHFNEKLSGLIGDNYTFAGSFTAEYDPMVYWILFTIFVLCYIYFVAFDYLIGQTPGKMLFRIYVVDETNNKETSNKGQINKITLTQSMLRNMSFISLVAFFPIAIFDYGYGLFNKNKQRFFEKMSKTKTIEQIEI